MSTIAGNTSDNQKLLAEALISIKRTQQKLQLLEAEKSEPIAIVSASCRLPGQVNDLESFRQFLSAGQDGITDLPADRWDMEHYYTDDRTTAGKMCVRRAGVIENTDCFDAGFFRISPKEAEKMDPQQRLLLELAWESLEKANIIPESLYNQSVGVFIGISTSDYLNLLIRRIDESEINGYVATGNSFSTAAGRISYYLGLKGPCIALDTACSSSLTAIHLACESLRKKECNYALAGGVNLLLEPLTTTAFSQAGMLSPDGSCKTFDASANGYVRSEGGGMVVLKRLTDAIADGDQILAKILGSATNHNGPSGGLTVPNGTAQQALIQQALKNAKIDSGDVSYVEAHGTGTSLGDPIEINALQQVFSKSHGEGESLLVGSVKTNIGHLEAAAGIAGMLKLICQLQSREIYPHLHLSTPNPYILWDTLALKIPTKKAFWKANGKKRIGGVSSFGVNGSNAHVILEEYLPTQEKQPFVCHIDDEHPAIIPISAKNKERLQAYVRRLLDFVQATDKAHEPGFLANLAYTCQTGREAMEERVTFRVHHISELQEVLEQYLVGEENIPGCYQGRVKKERELVVEEKGVDTLAERWVNGEAVDWNLLHTTQKPNKISLPTYPFARERYWALLTNMASGNANTAQANLHPLVHVNVSDLAAQAYRSVFTGEESFLKDHRVRGKKILSGTCYLEMALEAGRRASGLALNVLSDVTWVAPLIVQDAPQQVFITLYPEENKLAFEIGSGENDAWLLHCKGYLLPGEKESTRKIDVPALLAACPNLLEKVPCDALFKELGFEYGSFFQHTERIQYGDRQSISTLRQSDNSNQAYLLHPGQLDAALRTAIGLALAKKETPTLVVPFSLRELSLLGDTRQIRYAYARPHPASEANAKVPRYDMDLLNDAGEVIVSIRDFAGREMNRSAEIPKGNKAKAATSTIANTSQAALVAQDFASKTDAQLRTETLEYLKGILTKELHISADKIQEDTPFYDYGVDSMTAVDIIHTLEEVFGPLPATLLFEQMDLAELADYFVAKHRSKLAGLSQPSFTQQKEEESADQPFIKSSSRQSEKNGRLLKRGGNSFFGSRINEDMAIVGMEGLFPGAPHAEALWNQVLSEQCPEYIDQNGNAGLHFGRVKEKDLAEYMDTLGLSKEALVSMSRQQRMILGVTAEAMAKYGISRKDLSARKTGVFIGAQQTFDEDESPSGVKYYDYAAYLIPNKISFLLNLQGPSEVINTHCTSVYVALHRAIQSIHAGECEQAIVGGVNVISEREFNYTSSIGYETLLSLDHKTRSFCEDANGFVRSEGAGVVIIKRLSQAERDSNKILAVIKGTAVYHGGRGFSMEAPSAKGIKEVIKTCLEKSGITPDTIDYVEAHGIANRLADAIELGAISEAYRGLSATPDKQWHLSSVKPAVGHAELAAGMASLIKTLKAFEHHIIPGIPGLDSINKDLAPGHSIVLQAQAQQWPQSNYPKRAALNSYAVGGVNAHIILEEYVAEADRNARNKTEATVVAKDNGLVDARKTFTISKEVDAVLAQIVEEVFELDIQQLDLALSPVEYGFDSVKVVQFTRRINERLEIDIKMGQVLGLDDFRSFFHLLQREWSSRHQALPSTQLAAVQDNIITQYPISEDQKALCFIQEAWPDSTAYNIPLAFGLPGKINPDWLQQAFALVLAEHPILRVNFIQDKETGHRVQTVRPLEKCVQIDTQAITEGQDVTSLLLSLLRQPFNLAEDSLIRLHVREHISANKTYLLFVVHHIVFDGTSSAWFIQSFWDKYQQLVSGKHQSAKPVDLAYFDYVEGEHTYLESPQAKKDLAWWKATLEGISPALPLPYDRLPTGEGFDASVGCETFTLKTTELAALKEVAKAFKTNLSVLLLAVFNVLIHKLTQEEDIAITAPTAGRPKQIHENSIGFYIHVIVTRSQVQAQQSFEALVKDVRQKFVDGIDHASYPFSSLMSALGLGQLHSRELNFPVAYMFQNIFEAILDNKSVLNGLEILDTIYQETDNKYTLEIYDLKETLQVNLKYNQGLFDRTTIQRHLGYFHQLVQAVIANPQGKIADYPILSSEEKYQLVTSFNDTLADYPQEVCLHELFEAQAKKTPHQVAIAFGEEQLSYQALEQQSTQLACYLQQQGVTPDTLVGICMERSIEVIVAILGVLKSGAAYVPIDPHYPKDRILYVLEDSQVPFVLTQGKLKEKIQRLASQTQCQLLSLEDDWETGGPLTSRLTSQVRATNLAYVIYTSGSTGKPKGVMVEHAAVVNYVLNFIEQFKVNASDKFIHGASISFDISIEEIFPILLSGGCLVISKDGYLDVDGFVRELHDHQVTIVSTVPAVIQQLNSRPLKNLPLRLIISGADVLKPQWISELQPSAAIYNTYGPTEATVCASYYKIEGVTQGVQRIPIGKPIRNTQIYLLDKALSVVPIGVAGELHIAGAGLARGYLNRPALTEEKFINNPWGTGRLYKTGDQARWLADGNIEYLGRIDEQIKVRGLRIEPGEIESILTTHAPIQQAVVIARDQQGDKQLIAYYVATEAVEAADLRSHLQKTLPDYMIPAAFLRLEEIPLLATGKVNRKWLQTREVDLASSKVYVAPRTAIESALATIWEAVLGIEKVGIYDNFFELGGDSLLVTRVVSAIRKNLSVELAIKDLFSRPSIALLSELISTEGQEALLPEIIAGERPAKIPLSFSQQRLWFIDKLEGSIHYHIPFALRFEGNLDKDSLNDAFREIVNRHEALRTVFKDQDGEAYQEVLEKNQWQLVYTAASNTDGKEQLEALLASEIRQPFDLSKDHMLRAHVVKLAEQTHVLLVVMHHIASDGWSVAVLAEELIALYTAKKENRLAQLPALPIQYSDYALWQRAYLTEAILKDKLRYWQEKLSRTTALNLPSDHLRPAILSNKGGRLHFAIAKPLRNQLTDLSKQEGVTMFMLLLSAFKVLLYRYSGQEDICVGSPIANRVQKEVEPLIGFFVNTLVLRSNLGQNPRFTEVLSQVKATTLEAYAHQDVPLEKIVDSVEQDRAMSRSPLFQVMFVLQNTPAIPKLSLDGITLETEPVVYNVSKLDLTFHVTETAEGLDLMVEYCSDLFLPATINRMMAHYQRLLSDVVAHPMKEIGKLRMLSVAEEQQLRLDFNPTSVAGPPNTTLVDLLEAQAGRTPDQMAVVFQGRQLTYQQLHEQSNQLAHYLRAKGIREDSLIPLCVPRSLEMLIGLLGIIKAGAAYVPVDLNYPQERIDYMLRDTNAQLIISTQQGRSQLANQPATEVILLDSDWPEIASYPTVALPTQLNPQHLAYVIYTSGTTGQPKGVMVAHQGVVNMVLDQSAALRLRSQDRLLQCASLSFDASCFELFNIWVSGGAIVLPSQEELTNPDALAALIAQHSVTVVAATPSFQRLLGEHLFQLKTVISGGEALDIGLVRQLQSQGIRVINSYGPTETTVCITMSDAPILADGRVTIGQPLNNVPIYLLDKALQLVPVGVAGELYVGGRQVARGYLNQPVLTQEKFIADPFSQQAEARLYKTGDMARWLPDGRIELLGRQDEQVKIRGHRIELGEVEAALQQTAGVLQSVVVAQADGHGSQRLVGYVVMAEAFDSPAILSQLRGKLPEYMVPSLLLALEQLPLTPNGKVDKKALPNPTFAPRSQAYIAPRTLMEEKLAVIWQELLKVERVGIHDNFFELGGDSIITIQVVSRAKRAGIPLQPRDLFQHQTLAALAACVREESGSTAEQGQLEGESPLLPIQHWFFAQSHAEPSHFNQAVLLQLDKQVSQQQLSQAMTALVSQHDALRFQYTCEDGSWTQSYGAHSVEIDLVDLKDVAVASLPLAIAQVCDQYQRSLDIEKGALFRMVFIQTPASTSHHRLFLVIHHLVVDGVSWRILLQDLQTCLDGLGEQQPIALYAKSSSYRQWAEALAAYAESVYVESQLPYWQSVSEANQPLPVDKVGEVPMRNEVHQHQVKLAATLTSALVSGVHQAYATGINDLLLAALGQTIQVWTHDPQIVIGLEGHGREYLSERVEISQTVGWFTNLYPVRLTVEEGQSAGNLIKSIKEQLRAIPDKGLGYGALRYLHPKEEVRASLSGDQSWGIVFNYLGQLDNAVSASQWLSLASESTGISVGEGNAFGCQLEINSSIVGGQLEISWNYAATQYESATIAKLAEQYLVNLGALISHCQSQPITQHTPSDYGLGNQVSYQELDAFLQASYGEGLRRDAISALYSLSPLQEGMLFHGLYDQSAYIEQLSCDLLEVETSFLKACWDNVLENHSVLRSGFYYQELPMAVQCVYDSVSMPFEELDYRRWSPEEQKSQWTIFLQEDRARGFDFGQAPLMRITLIRLSATRYKMLWTSHHILLDGWSMPVIMGEWLRNYECLVAGEKFPTRQEDKYADFIDYLKARDSRADDQFWQQYLSGLSGPTFLPFVASTEERNKGGTIYRKETLRLDASVTAAIRDFTQRNRLTVNTLMQGAWALLLANYTQSKDVVYGVIVSGRPADLAGAEQRVGLYINTIPLRATIDEAAGIVDWLQALQQNQTVCRDYQHSSLAAIQQGQDLFDTLMIVENYPLGEVLTQDWSLQVENVQMEEQTNYLLSIIVNLGKTITIDFSYNAALLQEPEVKMIKGHFEHLLPQLTSQSQAKMSEIEVLTEPEKYQLLTEFTNTAAAYPIDKTIVDLLEAQVARTPTQVAVVFEGQALTYAELNDRSNQLAHYLTNKGVQKESLVAICIERSLEMLIGLLGIIKAGAAYVPIDPAYPQDRIDYMFTDSGAKLILSSKPSSARLPERDEAREVIWLDEDWSTIAQQPTSKVEITIQPQQLVYVIYTSGSTGRPKGVMIEHGSLVNLVLSQIEALRLSPQDKTLQFSSLSFDASCYEIFNTLASGGCLVIPTKEVLLSMELLGELIAQHQITVAVLPPSYQPIIQSQIHSVKTLVSAGEALKVDIARPLQAKGIRVINAYGPTENTVCVTLSDSPLCEDGRVTIGQPLSNVQVYLLDKALQLVPVGVAGELYVGGRQVARGYLNQPILTQEKFIPDPFSQDSAGRLYKTGDMARWLPDGRIELLGRQDEQVKIRGHRIELGEVETALQQMAGVLQSVVVAQADGNGSQRLVGYVVMAEAFDAQVILSQLRGQLPEYMVPSLLMALDQLPLMPNGKVDKKALPNPTLAPRSQTYVAPRTHTEEKLAVIWQQLLKVEGVGIHDNFFELGGHSLLATRVVSAIRKELLLEVSIKDIFTHATLEGLAMHLQQQGHVALLPSIQLAARPLHIPLSYAQERLWFIDQLQGSLHYHIPAVLRLQGVLDKEALTYALSSIVNRHEVLRTVVQQGENGDYQQIKQKDAWSLAYVNRAADRLDESNQRLATFIEESVQQPFDLSKDDMLRAQLVELAMEEHVLIITAHHIAADGWSVSILVQELVEFYQSKQAGRAAILPELPVQYADYSIWQRAYLQEKGEDSLRYWKKQLTGVTPLTLLTDYARPALQTTRGGVLEFSIDQQVSEQVKQLCQAQEVTLFMGLLTVFKVLLYRYSGQEDICVGTPIAGRDRREVEPLIGFFINMLALRSNLAHNPSFSTLLQQIKGMTLEAYAHQQVPFEKVVERVVTERDTSRSPLFQVMFVLQNAPEVPQLRLGEVSLQSVPFESHTTKFDLTFAIEEGALGLQLMVEYNKDLYTSATIEKLVAHYKHLLASVVKDVHQPIATLPMLNTAEEQQLRVDFNPTSVAGPPNTTLVDLLEAQAGRSPDQMAVVFQGRQLTYQQLHEQSNQLAHYLRAKGIREDSLIPLCVPRSLEMLIGLLGIIKAGAAYVPVDLNYPQERIDYMLRDTNAQLIISTQQGRSQLANQPATEVILLDSDWPIIASYPTVAPPTQLTAQHLAYVIYTSGTTGQPKGVMVAHQGVVNMVLDQSAALRLRSQDRLLQCASLSFDASCFELFNIWVSGGAIVLPSQEELTNPDALGALIAEHSVTVVAATPSFQRLLGEHLFQLKAVISGGEALDVELVRQLQSKGIRTINSYGPTETTVCVAFSDSPLGEDGRVTIGQPLKNVPIYLLDKALQLVPIGVAGELYVGGRQVARGYLNQPVLTQEKFIADPFSQQAEARLYKTGDMARWLPDGSIELLGRQDEQVKIRGHRIELGEVEAALQQMVGVLQSVVVAQADGHGSQRLVGYVVMAEAFDSPAILSQLRRKLPEYMVPSLLVSLEQLPLTPNGKVDKKALPNPTLALRSQAYIAPRTLTEEKLALVWQQLLKVERVGIHDNFFELGGHSLLTVQLQKELAKLFSEPISIASLFDHPTIASFCQAISKGETDDYPIAYEQELLTLADLPPFDKSLSPTYMQHVLLTGCTGFLGAFILRELLENTEAMIYCLVRCSNLEQGGRRINSALAKYGLWKDAYASRVKAVKGDLSEPKLGIPEDSYQQLTQQIDCVIHNGTYMNHLSTYKDAKKINVDGAKEVLKFAVDKRLKRVHYVSTMGVFGHSPVKRTVDEQSSITAEIHYNSSGYNASKWVAENVMRESRALGIPVTIYRPGLVTYSSDTKLIDQDQWLSLMIETCKLTNKYPVSHGEINAMSVDMAAKHLVFSIIDKNNANRTFHLWNHASVGLEDILSAYFGSALAQMEQVSFSAFVDEIRGTDLPLSPMLLLLDEGMKAEETSEVTIFSSKESESYFQTQYSSRLS